MANRRKRGNNNNDELKLIPEFIGEGDGVKKAKDYACIPCSTTFLRWFTGILALIAAFSILPIIIVQYYQNSDAIANQRCIVNAPFSNASSSSLTGMIQMDTNTRLFVWNLRGVGDAASLNAISSISVVDYAGNPLFTACGVTVVCQMNNQVIQTDPDALSIAPFMYQIRALPFNYYYNISTPLYGNAVGQFCA